jgi:putative ABC transport system permease protein
MQRRQVRASIRWEAVLIALLGTLVGTALGLGFAWTLVHALAGEGIDKMAIPGARLVVIVVVGAQAAVLAAALPARRAARLEILQSITT